MTIANSVTWRAITGERPPVQPPTATDYTQAGLPWFDYYAADAKALDGSAQLVKAKSVAEMVENKGERSLPEIVSIDITHIVQIHQQRSPVVREAKF